MKLYLLVPWCAAVALPLAVTAEPPVDEAALGEMEAIVARCGQVNPTDSAKYKELLTPLISDMPDADIEAARRTEAYRQAYEAISEQLRKATKDEVVAACADALAANN
ncbi:hypothetical protein [Collimonas silvisoli]|uniref:hypothetical protein n=1 Tax=Collimonas silvisoli TaxID=2825884 RepID=UPI001B8AD570|nr:hypothetical protein [Collimonas silvisoli]